MKTMKVVMLVIAVIAMAFAVSSYIVSVQENTVYEYVFSVSGNNTQFVDSFNDRKNNPFEWYEVTDHTPIRHFTFEKNGKKVEGWVRFGVTRDLWVVDGKRFIQ